MSRRKLQVFVSSTFTDLQRQRQAAVEAILQAGHIPAGMELFGADDKAQMEVIRGWIADSDVFLILLGGRYGTVDTESGKSYTHLEYEHALALRKPVLAMVMTDDAIEARGRTDLALIERENGALLKKFRTTVTDGRLVSFFRGDDDLKLHVMVALANADRREELVGWMRGSEAEGAQEARRQVALLTNENAVLRARNAELEAFASAALTPDVPEAARSIKELSLLMAFGPPEVVRTTYYDWFQQVGRHFTFGAVLSDVHQANEVYLHHLLGRPGDEVHFHRLLHLTSDAIGAFGLFGWVESRNIEDDIGYGRRGPTTGYFLTELGRRTLLLTTP